ncbi:FRG domain-containing protein [Bacteroides ovatus]|uniref:FRG domain-containing protein n=1 Tax=Bacteroides ovatus TaxID=28116 RepID=UPI001F19CE35|nr:FRG domain-containing protein [Bacteroides ovatus]MCE8924106.1 FRG domain-containing protein [Bacteroides ovatus]
MITPVADRVIRGYIKEACNFLGFDEANIRVIYAPIMNPVIGIPQHTIVTPDGCIIFDESWVNNEITNETPTKVRCEVYCKVRMLYKQTKYQTKMSQYENKTISDAITFSCVLMTLKGLTLPMPPIPGMAESLLKHIQQMLKDEFDIEAEYYQISEEYVKVENVWKFKLTAKDEQKYVDKFYTKQTKSTILVIDPTEKGTESNPFDNINEAFEYIQRLEADTYANDALLKDITSQQYFYDLNSHQFRVPWASPYVAFYNDPNIPSDGFVVNQNQVHADGKFHFTLKPNLYGKKFLYRGQSRDYPKPCTPNLFRDETKSYYLNDLIWSQEIELLLMTHPLVKLLEQGIDIMHDHFSILMNLQGLTQHYYHKTRFLDLTSDINAAKFFATTNYDNNSDIYTPVHNSDNLGMIYCYELQMPFAFAQKKDHDLSVIGKQVFMRSGAQRGFLLGMNKGMDLKTMPQVKKFYFRHDPAISDEIFRKSDYGKKYFTMDILEEAWKTEYKQRLEQGIVSADTVRLNVSRNPGETFETICKKLKERNITVDNSYHPSFTPTLIDKYYESIEKGWWEEFCSDIYFHGGDAALYKDCLMNISKQAQYKWAFSDFGVASPKK